MLNGSKCVPGAPWGLQIGPADNIRADLKEVEQARLIVLGQWDNKEKVPEGAGCQACWSNSKGPQCWRGRSKGAWKEMGRRGDGGSSLQAL